MIAYLNRIKNNKLFHIIITLSFFLSFGKTLFAIEHPLTLKQAIQISLEKNLDIKTAEQEEKLGEVEIFSAESVFDTTLTSSFDWKDDQDKPASALSGARNITGNINFGIEKKWCSGTTLDIQFKNVYKDTQSSVAPSKTFWDPRLEFNIKQPILKNFFGINDRKILEISKLKDIIQKHRSKDNIEVIIADVAKLYLDFAFSRDNIAIKQKALQDAQRLLWANQKKLKLGTVEETDLLASQANILARENDLLIAQNQADLLHKKIKVILHEISKTTYIPIDSIQFKEHIFNLNPSLEKAFEKRKDYLIAQKDLEAKNLSSNIANNSLYPQMDLAGTIASNGLKPDYSSALSEVGSFDFPTYFAGVTFKYPLGNTSAKGSHIQARIEKLSSLYHLEKLKNEIRLEIAQKIASLNTLSLRAKTSEKILRLLKQKMIAEEKKFNQGRSSINFVIQFQEDYLNGATGRIQAIIDYEKAVIDFKKSEGTLLDFLF